MNDEEFGGLLGLGVNKVEKEKSFGSNILVSHQRRGLSTKVIYVVLFICFVSSIVLFILFRVFLIKRKP